MFGFQFESVGDLQEYCVRDTFGLELQLEGRLEGTHKYWMWERRERNI